MTDRLRKRALLVGTAQYDDGRYAALPSARADVEALQAVLADPRIGAFDEVSIEQDPDATTMRYRIEEFLDSAVPDELTLLFVSGHGARLSQSTSEFVFVTSDTDSDRLQQTGVRASFVNERLGLCGARQKVAILDSCLSGGFAVDFATRAAKAEMPTPLDARGVYVLSSSGAGEYSYAGEGSAGETKPSVFTEEIVAALTTAHADANGDGRVDVDELYDYVYTSVSRRNLPTPQFPRKSALQVQGKIDLAATYSGPRPRSSTTVGKDHGATDQLSRSENQSISSTATPGSSWTTLLGYYRKCVSAEDDKVLLPTVGQAGSEFVYIGGAERMLSGDMDETATVPLTMQAAELAKHAAKQDAELWYGYPAIVLSTRHDGSVATDPEVAPLLVRRVQPVESESGSRLKPYGPVLPHPELAKRILGTEDADHLAQVYEQEWPDGHHDLMISSIRELLLNEFELPCVDELWPHQMRDTIDLRTPNDGARNVGMLLCAPQDRIATRSLLKDLADIEKHESDVSRTALATLFEHDLSERDDDKPIVAPRDLNDSQRKIIQAAMTRRLTVATGPPGTGKSQLVVNAVATALSAGQSVLVASSNNRAVDEVRERCDEIARGALVRTGSDKARARETETLGYLSKAGPGEVSIATARADFDLAVDELGRVASATSAKATRERKLLELGRLRERLADRLGVESADFGDRIGDDNALSAMAMRFERSVRARILGSRRRRRMINRLGFAGDLTQQQIRDVGDWIQAEISWRELRREASHDSSDEVSIRSWKQASERMRWASEALVYAVVHKGAATGWRAIQDILNFSGGSDWGVRRKVLQYVRGWAVTCLSARRFPFRPELFDLVIVDEASQCATPQVLPLLFRARRALIIGDPMQLQPVVTLKPKQEALVRREEGIEASWLEDRQLTYHRHSAFHAFEHVAGESFLLNEHYRCHPRIAEVSNQLFYGGRLTVLTRNKELRRAGADRTLSWPDVRGRAEQPSDGGSWINRSEAEYVSRCVRWLLKNLPADGSVGVVTPFRAQANLLNKDWDECERVQVGTVNTFQGGERDAIVISLVATSTMSAWTVKWLTNNRNLWNVAITRAKSHLVFIGDKEFWVNQGGVPADLEAAVRGHTSTDAETDDPELRRLYGRLSAMSSGRSKLMEDVDGYTADAVTVDGDRPVAIVFDRGHHDGVEPGQHLRVQHAKLELLEGSSEATSSPVRVPAWTLYSEPNVRLW